MQWIYIRKNENCCNSKSIGKIRLLLFGLLSTYKLLILFSSSRMKKKWFTLMELTIAITIFAVMFSVIFSVYSHLLKTKLSLDARALVITTTYDLVEKINVVLQNYTIDYEEYFNRGMVGCTSGSRADSFIWTGIDQWNCLLFDWMWNQSSYLNWSDGIVVSWHYLYSCSSDSSIDWVKEDPDDQFATWNLVVQKSWSCYEGFLSKFPLPSRPLFPQAYGQYAKQFIDVKQDVDDKPWRAWDDDDTDTGTWPVAIYDNKNVKELYLIAKDKKTRVFIRNKLIESWDVNGDALITLPQEKHFVLQMLQLKAFDAWENHDFVSAGTYDGVIDTWACDASAWFVCNGPKVSDVYSGYRLPANGDDGWINLTNNDISVFSRNMEILPTQDPKLAWADPSSQMNPFIKLNLTTGMYGKSRWSRIWSGSMNAVIYDLQTSFNIKSNY